MTPPLPSPAASSGAAPSWLAALTGRFIVFEGPDGTGKSTQLRRLVALCQEHGLSVCEVREPGGTDVGEAVRRILLDKAQSAMTVRAEMLLYMASRAQLVEQRIVPALGAGSLVIADRYVLSTLAYQGSAGGLPEADILEVAKVACRGATPDLNLVFDVDEQTAARRAGITSAARSKRAGGEETIHMFADRMEDRTRDFRCKVREGYLEHAQRDPARHAVINAAGTPDEVWQRVVAALTERFSGPARR